MYVCMYLGVKLFFRITEILLKLAEDALLYRKIVFTGETHFWLNGYVNKQIFRFWSEDQPELFQKLPMHLIIVTVW